MVVGQLVFLNRTLKTSKIFIGSGLGPDALKIRHSDWLLKIFNQLKAQNQRSVNLRCKFSLLDQPSYHTVV